MANEITASATLRVVKTGVTLCNISTGNKQFDLTGDEGGSGPQLIGTTPHELLTVNADVGSGGWAFFQNLDITNYVELGVDAAGTFYPLAKLKAGAFALIPLTTAAVYAKANAAACKLLFQIFEA